MDGAFAQAFAQATGPPLSAMEGKKIKRKSGASGWKKGNEKLKHTRFVAKMNKMLIEQGGLIRPGWLIEQLLAKSRPVRHRIKGKKSDPDNHLRVVTAEDSYVGNTKGTDQRKTCPLSGGSIPGNLDLLQIKVPPQSTIDCRGTTIEIPRDGPTG